MTFGFSEMHLNIMLKQYLKQNHLFRATFGPLLRLLAKFQFTDASLAARCYRESVLGGVVILAPRNIAGQFEVSATSELASRVVRTGCYEHDVTKVLNTLKLKEGLIVNVGANVGFYSIFLATVFPKATKVLAIEPNPEAFRLLQKNIIRNELSHRIQAIQTCIGDTDGKTTLSVIAGMPEYSSIGGIAHPGVASCVQASVEVPIAPLGNLVGDERVSLIFVDTEGAEETVFGGATKILLRDKPLLYFECSDTLLRKFGSSTKKLEVKLKGLGYVVRNGLCRQLALQHPYEGEAIAIHKEDLASWS
jgi:FkbM family methyltransferase